MIAVRLVGGLGNQMFQYACGRALAERMRTQLLIDRSSYGNYRLRDYGLGGFNVRVINAPWYLRTGNRTWDAARRLGFTPAKYLSVMGMQWINEAGNLRYQRHRLVFKGSAYLDGYWQSARYFEDYSSVIRDNFCLSNRLFDSFNNAKNKLGIGNGVTVSVHIRRGDYVTNQSANKMHGLLGIDYYHRAFNYLTENLGYRFKLVFFSDDIEWIRRNLNAPVEVMYVDANQRFPQIDMHLMAACDHHVIANSSFSWWGAWLNPSTSKKVIAPVQWFKSAVLNGDDICPTEWVRL